MAGYTSSELLTMRFGSLFEVETTGVQAIEGLPGNTGNGSIEKVLVRKDGRQMYVELTSKNMQDSTLQCFMRDISARKTLEQKLSDFHTRINNMAVEVSIAEERERNRADCR